MLASVEWLASHLELRRGKQPKVGNSCTVLALVLQGWQLHDLTFFINEFVQL
jgi:hypothetical protein